MEHFERTDHRPEVPFITRAMRLVECNIGRGSSWFAVSRSELDIVLRALKGQERTAGTVASDGECLSGSMR